MQEKKGIWYAWNRLLWTIGRQMGIERKNHAKTRKKLEMEGRKKSRGIALRKLCMTKNSYQECIRSNLLGLSIRN